MNRRPPPPPIHDILEAIGNTPLVRLRRVAEDIRTPIYAKCEFMNPGASIKDRIGPAIIEEAERRGALRPGGRLGVVVAVRQDEALAIGAEVAGQLLLELTALLAVPPPGADVLPAGDEVQEQHQGEVDRPGAGGDPVARERFSPIASS